MTPTRTVCIAALCGALAACGGGGGGDFDDSADPAAAWRNWLALDATVTVVGEGSDGARYTLVLDVLPRAPAAYPLTGAVGARSEQRVSLVQNGTSLGTTVTTTFFNEATARFIGAGNDAGECATGTASGTLPRVARPGDGGLLYAATSHDRCDGAAQVVGSVTADWSIEAEDGIVFFCVNSALADVAGGDAGSEQDCLEVGVDGTLGTLARVSVVLPRSTDLPNGFRLVARNY